MERLPRGWALTALPAALLVGLLTWPSVQQPPTVTPSEVPAEVQQRDRASTGEPDVRVRTRSVERAPATSAPVAPPPASVRPTEAPVPVTEPSTSPSPAVESSDEPAPPALTECLRNLLGELDC